MLQYLVIVGAAVQLYGIWFYIRDTIKGKTQPNRVTWLLWSIAPMIATFAAFSSGVRWAILPVFMSGFAPFLVFVASFANSKAYWKLGRLDYICGFFSLLALVLWGITKEPVIAIVFAIASDALAAAPTLFKAWLYPETETSTAYSTGAFNALTGFAAVKLWIFSQYGFTIYLVLINLLILLTINRKKFF